MNVKVCNLRSAWFGHDFVGSLEETGFAVVTHHGVDHGLIREMQQVWKEFFLSSQANKDGWCDRGGEFRGYKGLKTEKAVGASKADLKEFFHFRPEWELPSEVANPTRKMFFQLEDVAGMLLSEIDQSTRTGTSYRKDCESSDNTILRTIYYPALNFDAEPGAVRSAAHEDINYITLLVAASAPGLQVKDKEGNWHDVPHESNSIVVNIGDMLQLASRGKYKSTTHRVVNPENSKSDRVSMPLFVHPYSETLLADGFTAGQYLAQRIAEINQKVK